MARAHAEGPREYGQDVGLSLPTCGFFSVLDATWYSDGSLLARTADRAAVRVENGRVCDRILIPLSEGQVAEGKVEGMVHASERALRSNADQILMVTDSQAAQKAILSMCPRTGQHRAIRFDELVRSASKRLPALRITVLWTPAHVGTFGNELADDAAKAATHLPPPQLTPVSLTSCKRAINCLILERWAVLWCHSTTGQGLHDIDDSSPTLILRTRYLSMAS
ncbi:hypothetical protein K438DRAFT_1747747 [Mycena galopus ATCC 62051]|nr:hypothetical protein K438DRAFT_1747747 [Mycena galopus ATCC 62051]